LRADRRKHTGSIRVSTILRESNFRMIKRSLLILHASVGKGYQKVNKLGFFAFS